MAYHISSGMVSSGLTLSYNSMYIYSRGTANYTTLNYGCNMYICLGGTANNTTLNDATMYISSGGTANSTTVKNSGRIYISSGGTANNTTVNSSGYMYIDSGGTANNTAVSSGGTMYISSGGTATNVIWTPCVGYVSAADGAYVTYASKYSGVYLGSANHLLAYSKTMSDKTVSGSMYVMNGGTANRTTNSGCMYIWSGGTANSTTVNSSGNMYISSGGKANSTTVNSLGCMRIYSGGTANSTTVNGGDMYISLGGTANSTTVSSGGDMYIYSGGTANNTNVKRGGEMYISSGGTANRTTLNNVGYMTISSGGTANSTTVSSGGRMYISSGGTHRGTLQIASGAVVSAYDGAVIDFTISEKNDKTVYLVNDLSQITGLHTYTITVNTTPENGTYKLAQGADDLNNMVTAGKMIIGNRTVDYGTITVNGEDFAYNGRTYSLDQVNGNLTLTIDYLDTDNDLDGNGLADTVLVHTKQGFSGAWLTTGDKSVIKWGDLGNVNDKVELVGMGNVKGTTEEGSDIYLKIGTTVAAWVTDGGKVKSYKELYTLKSNMNMLGIGDFDGDGVTDYLLRSNTGDLGYVTGDDNKWHYIKGLGTEWKIAAVGDLDGNGTDDVIVRHDAGFTGAYMIGTDGKITWSNLDTLKSDMTLVGTGDFNGDGVDDVLLQNKSNGWVGAWLVEDGSVDSFIGICKNKNAIEQIADFNGDGIDDLRIRTDKGDIGVLYVKGADTTEWKYFQSVGKEWDTSFALIS